MTRPATYTIVRTDAGFHVRLIGGNRARIVWSEPYPRVARARRAIELACLAAGRAERPARAIAAAAEIVDERPRPRLTPSIPLP